jgi:hypothetical protein
MHDQSLLDRGKPAWRSPPAAGIQAIAMIRRLHPAHGFQHFKSSRPLPAEKPKTGLIRHSGLRIYCSREAGDLKTTATLVSRSVHGKPLIKPQPQRTAIRFSGGTKIVPARGLFTQ